ncbi:uncharacterized protein LOC130800828 isoform X4 [Amaranthus tricolor]|uniref:uncharacterized protein LOC130800828 isoform X4 n=1 Tax=Amaranthus tricolor TaxID=29722 RepID=UPI0025887740|nr:uncharacterized protein LOC130800828 isoform X4 [Amaranthus tricolor]
MADSSKGNSSTGEAITKMSLLDEDFSKDFLASWKSTSASDGDDMDFNFEPVSKGKKKGFNFGMEDMDFSLDDAFCKMPSFKMDMADLDFSSSPKKPAKSKDKSAQDYAKGDRLDKCEKFTFSFDFDGLDDFSLNAPSSIEEKGASFDKKIEKDGSECGDFPGHAENNMRETTKDTVVEEPAVCENAVFSKSEDLVVCNDNSDIPLVNTAKELLVSTHIVQQNETPNSSDNKFSEGTQKLDLQSYYDPAKESSDLIPVNKSTQLIGSQIPVESAKVHIYSETERTMTAQITDDELQSNEETTSKQQCTHLKQMDVSANICLVEASIQDVLSEKLEISSLVRDKNDISCTGGSHIEGLPAFVVSTAENEKQIVDKSLLQSSMDKMNISSEKNDLADGDDLFSAKHPIDTVGNTASTGDSNALSFTARSTVETHKPTLKVSATSFGSGPNAAKITIPKNKVPGDMNSNDPVIQPKNDGGRTDFSAFKDNREGSIHKGSSDKSRYNNDRVNGKNRNEEGINIMPDRRKAAMNGLTSLECEKMVKNVKSSGGPNATKTMLPKNKVPGDMNSKFSVIEPRNGGGRTEFLAFEDYVEGSTHIGSLDKSNGSSKCNQKKLDDSSSSCKDLIKQDPILEKSETKASTHTTGSRSEILSIPLNQGTKVGNQGLEKVKDKVSSITIQKSDIGLRNKISSQKIDKKMSALPSLKLTSFSPLRNTITDKHPIGARVQENVNVGNFDRSTRLQSCIKIASPVFPKKQTLLTPSLKRKLSEAGDMDQAYLHKTKRVSPSENRLSTVSSGKLNDGAQTQENLLEGNRKNVTTECMTPKFDFDQEAKIEALQFSLMVENDANVQKAEACANELDNICNMLKRKHEEAKELLVRALVNNNNLLMLNHPVYEEKIRAVQKFASRLTFKELEIEA